MEELFKTLELPPDASKEEVRTAFLKWKKEQQKILVSGKPSEQRLITDKITRVTVMYKKFIGDSPTKKGNENPSPVNDVQLNRSNLDKNLIAFACIFVVFILGGLAFHSLKDSISMPSFSKPVNPLGNIVEKVDSFSDNLKKEPLQAPQKPQAPQESQKPPEKPIEPVEKTVEKPIDKNVGQTPNQRAAIQTLLDFHSGITSKNLRDSYNCLSMDFQNYMSYDGWTPGFATTVSSEVDNIKVVSESDNEIILNYVLKATDNIQGKQQVSYFNGTVNVINENGRWKIDNIKNKVR